MKTLFDPITIAGMKLKNRFFRSATYDGFSDDKGHPTARLYKTYEDLAKGGVGTIITGLTSVSDAEQLESGQMSFRDDSFIAEYRTMTDAVHNHGAAIILQLAFLGSQCYSPAGDKKIWGPSAVKDVAFEKTPREMSREEIARMQEDFATGALRAKQAGFDGVQLHMAHGYLLSRFLTPYYNRRSDEYGGSIENRGRALFETYCAVREKVGPAYPVLIKINSEDFIEQGMTFDECRFVCRRLVELGIDAIEVSGGYAASPPSAGPCRKEEGYFGSSAEHLAQELPVPVIAVGGNRDFDAMTEFIQRTGVTAVSLSRPLIREPNLVERWQGGDRRRALCISCNRCFKPNGTACVFNAEA
ncbi:NADH:flavin oxidoreductase [Geomonas azotofigens]|uniref:NADH:flavin oxidoreductase n=1 Tax=Geomonas azotofigens TaxID=2843196 RepID=UPI001C10D3A2|nr:NADH:flavin oxidoreductase [Geomonas azotofigens]MBU5614171.1 NADH:flavin oxidoreductase [Geomonas azotofigens]